MSGYPTVAFFKNGRMIEYKPKGSGAMTAVDIANTAFKKAKKFLKGTIMLRDQVFCNVDSIYAVVPAHAVALSGCRRDPEMVPDPESIMPTDWDEEEDGPWAPEMIKNPVCESQAKTVSQFCLAAGPPSLEHTMCRATVLLQLPSNWHKSITFFPALPFVCFGPVGNDQTERRLASYKEKDDQGDGA